MPEPYDTISRDQLLAVLRRRWLTVVQLTVVGALVGVALAYATSTRYEATATVLVGPTVSGSPAQDAPAGLTAQAAARLVQTRTVAQRVGAELQERRAPGALLADVSVEPDTSGAFLDITAEADTPADAAELANSFADQFVALRDQRVRERTQEAIEAAQRRIDALPRGAPERRPLMAGLAELRATAVVGAIDAEVVDRAVAGRPDGIEPVGAGLVGGGLGLLLGLVLAFSIEALDPRVRRLAEVRRLAGAPQLAAMRSVGSRRRRGKEALAATSRGEPIEHLRGALLLRSEQGGLDRLIVTSPADRRDGKTAVAANLAVSLARLGLRVCVVDADLREPSLGVHFDCDDRQPGLAEALQGTPVSELMQRVDMPAEQSTNGSTAPQPLVISVLAAGRERSRPSELLAGQRIESLLGELDRDHDVLIIDCPPLLAVGDALPLLRRASGTILVVRHGRTARNAIVRAAQVVTEAHGSVRGVVVTSVPRRELAAEGHGPWPAAPAAAAGSSGGR